jgi:hypothetical protein
MAKKGSFLGSRKGAPQRPIHSDPRPRGGFQADEGMGNPDPLRATQKRPKSVRALSMGRYPKPT